MRNIKLAACLLGSCFAASSCAEGRTNPLDQASDPLLETRAQPSSGFRYHSAATDQFLVKSLPDVHYDVGELYSGSIPVDNATSNRSMFFAFQPTVGKQVDEVTIFLSGFPGCSSLADFLTGSGRFVWWPGTILPQQNQYSWVNLTNMLWVDQPVGTGFSQGSPPQTADDISRDFMKWFKNFQSTFGIKNYRIFLAGDEFATGLVPWLATEMLATNDTQHFNVSGALIYSGFPQDSVGPVNIVPFVQENQRFFQLNSSTMDQIEALDKSCGFADYRSKYLTFPPSGLQPVEQVSDSCNSVFGDVYVAAMAINPCFSTNRISAQCPLMDNVLGQPTQLIYMPPGQQVYFDRADVKQAMHAPSIPWSSCGKGILQQATNDAYSNNLLGKLADATKRVLIGTGDLAFQVTPNDTLLWLQNTTWGGKLGFQQAPSDPTVIDLVDLQYQAVFDAPVNANRGFKGQDGPQGTMGVHHFERGLMYANTFLAGGSIAGQQPRSSYRHVQWLLGRIDSL